jgi:putative phosphoribosyl transferase
MLFRDRTDAGRRLASALERYGPEQPLIEALPRGGVPVGFEVAAALHASLDVLLVRKLGCPGQSELGLGAVGEGGLRLVNQDLVDQVGISGAELDRIAHREAHVLERSLQRFRGDRARLPVRGRTAIVVDDGLATGYTARAAVEVLRGLGARRVVLAVPVAPPDAAAEMSAVADDFVCLHFPPVFMAIGTFYGDFSQVTDDEVTQLLAGAQKTRPTEGSS